MTVRRVERDECRQQEQRAQTETDDGRTVPQEPHGARRNWRGAGGGRSTDEGRTVPDEPHGAQRKWRGAGGGRSTDVAAGTIRRKTTSGTTDRLPAVNKSTEGSVERLATVNLTTIWKSWGNLQSLGGGRDFPFDYEGKNKDSG